MPYNSQPQGSLARWYATLPTRPGTASQLQASSVNLASYPKDRYGSLINSGYLGYQPPPADQLRTVAAVPSTGEGEGWQPGRAGYSYDPATLTKVGNNWMALDSTGHMVSPDQYPLEGGVSRPNLGLTAGTNTGAQDYINQYSDYSRQRFNTQNIPGHQFQEFMSGPGIVLLAALGGAAFGAAGGAGAAAGEGAGAAAGATFGEAAPGIVGTEAGTGAGGLTYGTGSLAGLNTGGTGYLGMQAAVPSSLALDAPIGTSVGGMGLGADAAGASAVAGVGGAASTVPGGMGGMPTAGAPASSISPSDVLRGVNAAKSLMSKGAAAGAGIGSVAAMGKSYSPTLCVTQGGQIGMTDSTGTCIPDAAAEKEYGASGVASKSLYDATANYTNSKDEAAMDKYRYHVG
jgi:hypothetical protein